MDKSEANTTDAPTEGCKAQHARAVTEEEIKAFFRDCADQGLEGTCELREILERVGEVAARHGDILTISGCRAVETALAELRAAGPHARQLAECCLQGALVQALDQVGHDRVQRLQVIARAYRAALDQWEVETRHSLERARGYLDCIDESLASGRTHPVVEAYVERARTTNWAPELATGLEARALEDLMTATADQDQIRAFEFARDLGESARDTTWSDMVAARVLDAATVAIDENAERFSDCEEAHHAV